MKQNTVSAKKFKLAIIFGGPSLERGISINSARSVADNLQSENLEIIYIYVDLKVNFYNISASQLYSNTPADFDFKLLHDNKPLNEEALIKLLQQTDMVFPVVHGKYGEDGSLQKLLEDNNIPFIGSSSKTCKQMFNKTAAMASLGDLGYNRIHSVTIDYENHDHKLVIDDFFGKYNLSRAVLKPEQSGSSIGVYSVNNSQEALDKLAAIYQLTKCNNIILEEFCCGKEFTTVVIEHNQKAIAFVPSEINISYEDGKIFDYRSKYLPTKNISYSCPPNFDDSLIKEIQKQAEDIFIKFGMRDFARLDGWVLDDGRIIFSDLNPISGMEQNSFMFQQAAKLGMSHSKILEHILSNACNHYNKPINLDTIDHGIKKMVHVIFGGSTAERQVSVMSGTNVWLKLQKSKLFEPILYFLDKHGDVWELPYSYALSHTVEEILDNCLNSYAITAKIMLFSREIRSRLGLNHEHLEKSPVKMTLDSFLTMTKNQNAFLFLGLNGGEGENGILQHKLNNIGISYNGSDDYSSALCMDKHRTGIEIEKMNDNSITSSPKKIIRLSLINILTNDELKQHWDDWAKELNAQHFIIKPKSDGCSAGVVKIDNPAELKKYAYFSSNNFDHIPNNSLIGQNSIVELANDPDTDYILEPFIETDKITVVDKELKHIVNSGWTELTVGVVEKNGIYHAFNPSITVAENSVLTVEEKFQGGTGINITPPPANIISKAILELIKSSIEKVAACLKISNYARIDIFAHTTTGKIIVIEANSLPALTPSTVIFQQALAETPSVTPLLFLENIILSAEY
jgi:D-alanine--D-alanine ligase